MRLSVVLWALFVMAVAGAGFVLLRACGVGGWNFCPTIHTVVSSDAEREAGLRALIRQLEAELARRELACASIPKPPPPPLDLPKEAGPPRPQQTAELKPPPPPPPPPPAPKPPPPLPSDRWDKKDLTMLKGCWLLGRESKLTRGGEECVVKTGRICFGEDGTGQRELTDVCPSLTYTIDCSAPITATFGSDGRLHTTQPRSTCKPDGTVWNSGPNALSCQRVSDTMAMCRDGLGFEHEFRRGGP